MIEKVQQNLENCSAGEGDIVNREVFRENTAEVNYLFDEKATRTKWIFLEEQARVCQRMKEYWQKRREVHKVKAAHK